MAASSPVNYQLAHQINMQAQNIFYLTPPPENFQGISCSVFYKEISEPFLTPGQSKSNLIAGNCSEKPHPKGEGLEWVGGKKSPSQNRSNKSVEAQPK